MDVVTSSIVLTDQKVKADVYYYDYSQLDYLVLVFTMAILYSIECKMIVLVLIKYKSIVGKTTV